MTKTSQTLFLLAQLRAIYQFTFLAIYFTLQTVSTSNPFSSHHLLQCSVLGPAPPGHTRCLMSETPRCHSSDPRYPSPQLCQVPLGHSHFTDALPHNFRLYQQLQSFLSHHQLQCSVSTISSQVLLLPRGGGGESIFTVPQAKSI